MNADPLDSRGRLPCDGKSQPIPMRRDPSRFIGVVGTARREGFLGNVRGPKRRGSRPRRLSGRGGRFRESERPIVPKKPVTTVEERGLTSGVLAREPTVARRLAMSLATPEKIRRLQRKLYVKAKDEEETSQGVLARHPKVPWGEGLRGTGDSAAAVAEDVEASVCPGVKPRRRAGCGKSARPVR